MWNMNILADVKYQTEPHNKVDLTTKHSESSNINHKLCFTSQR